MRKVSLLLIIIFLSLKMFSQISATTQGVNCYNDSGSIFLVFDNSITFLSIDWEYSVHNSNNWISVDSFNTPFIQVTSTLDSLETINCGLFRLIYSYELGPQIVYDTNEYSISCPLTMGKGQDLIKCFGDSSGTLKRPVFGGEKFDPNNSIFLNDTFDGDEYYLYAWYYADDSMGTNSILLVDTTQNLIGIPAGWYKTVVTDAIGCTDTIGYIEFRNPQRLEINNVYTKNIDCRGSNTGSIGFTGWGGRKYDVFNKYFYYLIIDNDTIGFSDTTGSSSWFLNTSVSLNMQSYFKDSIQFDSLFAGEYILSIVDSFGCSLSDTFTIVEPLPYSTFASTTFPLICESDSGYLKIDSVLGGGNIQYGFTGSNVDSIYVPFGWYEMYIEDLDFNCIDTVPVRCYAQYEISVFETIADNSCFGDALGAIVIDSIKGGNFPYDVQWGGINNNALAANTYSVLIVDSIGCVHPEEFIVIQPNQLLANEVLYPPSCNGILDGSISINITGGTGSLNYGWLNAPSGFPDSLFGLSAGVYTLVVSDAMSCVDTLIFTLNEPEQIAFSYANYENPLLCRGAITAIEIAISGGTGPFSVLWNDGSLDMQRIIGAGNYSCKVTDANGCATPNTPIVFTEPDSLELTLVHSEISCNEGGMASISFFGGVQPLSVLWSTGDTSLSVDSLWGTTYWVIVTDSCGNSISDTFTLYPYLLETTVYYDDVIHMGSVEVDYTSTGGPFSYEWTDILGNVIGADSITSHLCEGTYFVTTTDITINCSVIDTLLATYYLPNGIIDEATTTVLPDSNLWGNSPYTYLWDNGEVLAHANVCSGSRWVEVTDKDGCVIRADFEIDPLLITLDPAETIIECNLENLDIDITADASGGTPPYTYSWSNGNTENSINLSLSPGNYSVIVMDNNACTEDTAFTIATMSAECIPNVFTPNGDNINDNWSLEDTFLYEDSEVRVYGRFGKLLFQSVGYISPWDGKNEKGNDVPEGAYFYSIEIGHEFDAIKGSVIILR